MNIYKNPSKSEWIELTKRSTSATTGVDETVSKILADIKQSGDEALLRYTKELDKVDLSNSSMYVDISSLKDLDSKVPEELKMRFK